MSDRGPLPRFGEVHVRKVLELLKDGKMGRGELSRKVGVGEGSLRTIIKKLKAEGLVSSTRAGHFLTEKGRKVVGTSVESAEVYVPDITVGVANVAVVVRKASHLVRRGVEQRDEAIKVGAKGTTVLICKGGKLVFPDLFMKVNREAEQELMRKFSLRDGDVVVIGTADDIRLAEEGARAAARSLRRLP